MTNPLILDSGLFDIRALYGVVVALCDSGNPAAARQLCDLADSGIIPICPTIAGGASLAAQAAYDALDNCEE